MANLGGTEIGVIWIAGQEKRRPVIGMRLALAVAHQRHGAPQSLVHWNAAERETRCDLPREEGMRRTRRQVAIAYLIGLAALTLGECLLRVGQVVFDLTPH